MNLNRKSLLHISNAEAPEPDYFDLDEKVLQFGTGVLLRGLPDYFIDKANKHGLFNGRIVVVKSTGADVSDFESQDSMYTHRICGIADGVAVSQNIINASVSRVLSAQTHWKEILQCASNAGMQLIISNTTEVGIVFLEEKITGDGVPASFPGKLLAFLHERYSFFKGASDKGMVIVPTELITGNGSKLKAIVLLLAQHNNLGDDFKDWLNASNYFCNSLVDRIVPGKPADLQKQSLEKELGVTDELMIVSEPYGLWAIETNIKQVKEILSFSKADSGVVIADDITVFRDLKLRLLNGTHTFNCGLAFLSGLNTVKEAMDNDYITSFVQTLMTDEITPAITGGRLTAGDAEKFSKTVLDRFRNPYIEHKWINITLQYSSKFSMRCVPLIINTIQRTGRIPALMSLGFAAHILFMKCEKKQDGKYYGERKGESYLVTDDNAAFYAEAWKTPDEVTKIVLSNKEIWKTDLLELKGLNEKVAGYLHELKNRYESVS